jgi:hypothetical protein
MEKPLVDNKCAAMTIDAGHICGTNLFIPTCVTSHVKCCFTAGIHNLVPHQDHKSYPDFVAAEFRALANNKKALISAVISDGATHQTNAVNWKDHASHQATHDDDLLLSRILDVSCLCHRLNNAYPWLIRDSPRSAALISALLASSASGGNKEDCFVGVVMSSLKPDG